MPELSFTVKQVKAGTASGAPELVVTLAIQNAVAGEQIQSIALAVQLQIEPARRRYSESEKQALNDLFGEVSRWPVTVRPIYWTTVKANVPDFAGRTEFDLRIPCEFESEVAAAKYMRAIQDGEVPVALLFSGRVMYSGGGTLQMAPIPWAQESSCRIPVSLVKDVIAVCATRGAAWM